MIGLGLRDGTGRVDLPGQRRAQLGILGEQVVEDRGPGAGLADDEDRRGDRLGGDVGMLFAPGDHLEPVLQGADDVEVGDLHPDRRQPRLVDQPVGDPSIQPGLPAVVAEVVAAGLLAGGGDQGFGVEPLLQRHARPSPRAPTP